MELERNLYPLVIKRSLEGGKASARVECAPGQITILSDEDGGTLPLYNALLAGKATRDRMSIEMNFEPFELEGIQTIGFNDHLPDDQKIPEFLQHAGYTAEEIPRVIRENELEKYRIFPCSHLPQVPTRHTILLATLKSKSKVIALNDPFLPFNGRWREELARMILDYCMNENAIIICTNMSFLPNSWLQSPSVQTFDVGACARAAISQLRGEMEKEKKAEEVKKKAEENTSTPLGEKKIVFEIPAEVIFKFRQTTDKIFAPLAEMVHFMRTWGGMVAVGCFAFLIVTMGFVMFPHLSDARAKLAHLAEKYEYATIADFFRGKSANTSSPTLTVTETIPEEEKFEDEELFLESEMSPFACTEFSCDPVTAFKEEGYVNGIPAWIDQVVLETQKFPLYLEDLRSLFCLQTSEPIEAVAPQPGAEPLAVLPEPPIS